MYRKVVARLHAMPRYAKKALMVCTDLLLIPCALWLALSLRLGELYVNFTQTSLLMFIVLPMITIPLFVKLGIYRAVVRYSGGALIQQILIGVVLSAAVVLALTLYNWPNGLPRSAFAIYGFLAFVMLSASRLTARIVFGWGTNGRGQRVAVYGAGSGGRQLVAMLRAAHEYRPIMLMDDNPDLIGREVERLRVYDPNDPEIEERLQRLGVVAVFLAMPSVSRAVKRRILKRLEEMPFHVYTVPGLEEIVSGAAPLTQLREVPVEDLLGRDPVPPDEALLERCIADHVVMVTGAGGSIGSELCRQIMARGPKTLLMFEQSEFALFSIESEMEKLQRSLPSDTKLVPVLGSVCGHAYVERIMREHGVQTVYHAAAYKHVPLVEHNPLSGITNNVFGTQAVATAARRVGVKHFVFVSTDKAVRPTNVMGASKRLGELILQSLASLPSETTFSMVRFGNVLGSSGSVVPRFRDQIRSGGPVTVTHAEIIRYFMTIQEAVELVIQAGALAKGGDVFVLDMGEPVKIYDLARQLVHLSGLEVKDESNPEGEIEIVFSGLRPGEKLYEELLIGGEVSGTEHPKILRAREVMLAPDTLAHILARLETAVASEDVVAVRSLLGDAVDGYNPYVILPNEWQGSEKKVASAGSRYAH